MKINVNLNAENKVVFSWLISTKNMTYRNNGKKVKRANDGSAYVDVASSMAKATTMADLTFLPSFKLLIKRPKISGNKA
jgi:hypothetical protein